MDLRTKDWTAVLVVACLSATLIACDCGDDPKPSGVCPAGECDLLTNAGCGGGQACYVTTADGGLVPACSMEGAAGLGARCTQPSDCVKGSACDEEGFCRAVCCGTGVGCPAGQGCAVQILSNGQPIGVGLCRNPDGCDLLLQTGCPSGPKPTSCYPLPGVGSGFCLDSFMNLQEGQMCTYVNDCAGGLACYFLDNVSKCAKFCDTTTASGCSATQMCQSLKMSSSPNLGLCVTK